MLLAQKERYLEAGWANATNIHPAGLAMLLLACFLLLFMRKSHAFLPILFITMFVTIGQRIVVAGLDFPFLRILVYLGLFRVVLMGETRGFKMLPIDWFMVMHGITWYTMGVVRESQWIYGFGWATNNLGAYFLCRIMLSSRDSVYQFVKWTAIFAIPVMLCFALEKMTARNMFSVFGGVSEHTFVREGKLRAQGSFQHPILAGCFFAGLVPMFGMLWTGVNTRAGKPMKFFAAVGFVAALVCVVCCSSSTPLLSAAAGIAAMVLFKFHKMTPYLRWGAFFGVIGLHMVMKAPVWALIGRIDLAGGSTGYHRYRLIDATINNFAEWALIGVPYTWHWGDQLFDVTGHYVLQCTSAGLLGFILYLFVLTYAFRCVRDVLRATRDKKDRWMAWVLGASLFTHCVSFIGVSYYGKPLFLLMLQMGALASMSHAVQRERRRAMVAQAPGVIPSEPRLAHG